nr:right-handed parallel beta-helix repeat-containing protein [Bacillota bacterium]
AYDSGGGIFCEHSSPTIENNTISGNSADDGGGGGIKCCDGSPTISNNTITDNTAHYGGGVCCQYSSPTIIDCILWGNGDDLYDCSATYSCIEDDDAGEGNIHDDPMFVTGPLGEYYLHPDSPCIDAGSRSASAASLSNRTTQADGTRDTGTVDMGYHYPIP